eukprot:CAMPEP_0177706216 /NCGR_PEP_ID=MMETSP0484_2-20121128/9109_1 /TAXON_ID=354590 /ORGANISM="Rhodomonas lens, Strain RHODO" /LENGTH=174 /DNA_ID=CAMNT_0019217667 /DNA_START=537 /DNA_END=1061 /DNA_ORIENTATION=+
MVLALIRDAAVLDHEILQGCWYGVRVVAVPHHQALPASVCFLQAVQPDDVVRLGVVDHLVVRREELRRGRVSGQVDARHLRSVPAKRLVMHILPMALRAHARVPENAKFLCGPRRQASKKNCPVLDEVLVDELPSQTSIVLKVSFFNRLNGFCPEGFEEITRGSQDRFFRLSPG